MGYVEDVDMILSYKMGVFFGMFIGKWGLMKLHLLCKSLGNGLWLSTLLNSSYDHLYSDKNGHIIWESDKPLSIAEINKLSKSYKANIIWGEP